MMSVFACFHVLGKGTAGFRRACADFVSRMRCPISHTQEELQKKDLEYTKMAAELKKCRKEIAILTDALESERHRRRSAEGEFEQLRAVNAMLRGRPHRLHSLML